MSPSHAQALSQLIHVVICQQNWAQGELSKEELFVDRGPPYPQSSLKSSSSPDDVNGYFLPYCVWEIMALFAVETCLDHPIGFHIYVSGLC